MGNSFLDLTPQIEGESLDAQCKNYCEILSWTWGMANRSSFRRREHDPSHKTHVDHVQVVKGIDLASATLAQYCALGTHLKQARLVLRKNDSRTKHLPL